MFLQVAPTLHHFVECALFRPVASIRVVQLAGSVYAETYQEIVLLEKCAPLIVEKDTVGLKCMLNGLTRSTILLYEFDRSPEELNLHQRWLAALPGYCY
jgi:hypothetical protein